ncbi:hypothetical protein KDX00_03080 [Cobetia amphilecti]|nr:hypothetical protein KDX00_03080 [Cobetia litoralis]
MSNNFGNDDLLLSGLIAMAESGATVGVTLYVNGSVITGELVSQKNYVKEIVRSLRSSMEHAFQENSGTILDALNTVGDMPNGSPKEEGEAVEFEFVHLSRAQCIQGGNWVPSNGIPWRGKLSAVDGFMVGQMSLD